MREQRSDQGSSRLLLRDTDAKMGDTAERVGFESLIHFGRIFKELTGCPPLKYRHMQRSNRT
ncbi:helix-turn-helix domain-containing protein [Paenibacillus thiaminolyticus]|uniref:helix-turn-helix domain-containing protein n=1 Tax=Paenibacillus thiaminolyticus TaxID=49283 RepID=UPI0035A67868